MPATEVGDVRVTPWNQGRVRVLAVDAVEVLYDSWWPHLNENRGGWRIRTLREKASYYRLPTAMMNECSEWVGREPLGEDEWPVHRPDLPLRVLRKTGWRWSPESFSKGGTFSRAAAASGVDVRTLEREIVLQAPSIVVVPHGPKGGDKRGEILSADDGQAFRGLELLHKAHQIQAKYLREATAGAGIYRLGCSNQRPSFYLGGDRDNAGFLGNRPPQTAASATSSAAGEKVAILRLRMAHDYVYYIRDGAIWRHPGKAIPGAPAVEKVADLGFVQDPEYIYFLDRDGDVFRAERGQ